MGIQLADLKQTKKLVIKYAQLPVVDLSLRYMVQMVTPVEQVPHELRMSFTASNMSLDTLKEALLTAWRSDVNELIVNMENVPDWLSEVNDVELVECQLLAPVVDVVGVQTNEQNRLAIPARMDDEQFDKAIGLPIDLVLGDIRSELREAMEKWPAMNSAHEGYAVLLEEVDELWDHVKTNQKKRDLEAMRKEAIQVAAMAIRFAIEIVDQGRGRK